jgi:hypothetical protein
MKLKTRELEKLRSKLPPHSYEILWKRLNKPSIPTIKAVLRGNFNNDQIIDAAIQLAQEYQNELKERQEKISSL